MSWRQLELIAGGFQRGLATLEWTPENSARNMPWCTRGRLCMALENVKEDLHLVASLIRHGSCSAYHSRVLATPWENVDLQRSPITQQGPALFRGTVTVSTQATSTITHMMHDVRIFLEQIGKANDGGQELKIAKQKDRPLQEDVSRLARITPGSSQEVRRRLPKLWVIT